MWILHVETPLFSFHEFIFTFHATLNCSLGMLKAAAAAQRDQEYEEEHILVDSEEEDDDVVEEDDDWIISPWEHVIGDFLLYRW